MLRIRDRRMTTIALMVLAISTLCCARSHAHAVLLMEEPYGFFGTIFPVGHNAMYFEQVCAETPIKLRRCNVGELGAVITRDPNISGYDWVAIPLIPYLYSVESSSQVPAHTDRIAVNEMRNRYHESHLLSLGEKLGSGNLFKGGWALLVGMSYERRMYAFSFETTTEQDDALIARMNSSKNHSHFEFLYNNCSDFARYVLNMYYPRAFRRDIFRDAGMTTPKAISRRLVRFARKHPEMMLTVYEIPQVPGYRRQSRSNKSLTESLATTAYVVPLALFTPYVAGGVMVDYMVRSRFSIRSRHPRVLTPDNLVALTVTPPSTPNPEISDRLTASSEANDNKKTQADAPAGSDLSKVNASSN